MTDSFNPPPLPPEGVFSFGMGQMGKAIGDVWKNKRLLTVLGAFLLFFSLMGEAISVTIDPEMTWEKYFDMASSEYGVDEFSELLNEESEEGANETEGGAFELEEKIQSEDESHTMDDFESLLDEELDSENSPTPIYLMGQILFSCLIYFMQYIICIFIASRWVESEEKLSLGECWEAFITAPRRFYVATILKGFWVAGPFLLVGLVAAVLVAVSGAIGISNAITVSIVILAMIPAFIWGCCRAMSYSYIEFYALLKGMTFWQAKEASTDIMYGRRWGYFFALFIVVLAMSMAVGIIVAFGVMLLIIPAILIAMFAKWTAIAIGGALVFMLFAMMQMIPTFFTIVWMYRVWQWMQAQPLIAKK